MQISSEGLRSINYHVTHDQTGVEWAVFKKRSCLFLRLRHRAKNNSSGFLQMCSSYWAPLKAYLLIHFTLQLHNLVFHANMELLVAFHRASLNFEFLQLTLSHHPSEAALKVDDGFHGPLIMCTSQPATNTFLNDDCFVLTEYLQKKEDYLRL